MWKTEDWHGLFILRIEKEMTTHPLHRHALAVRKRRSNIIRMRREGYKIWRIVEVVGMDEYFVAAVLVKAGLMPTGNIDATLAAERKPDAESIAAKLRRMRRVRKNVNQKRRKGGGNWSGR